MPVTQSEVGNAADKLSDVWKLLSPKVLTQRQPQLHCFPAAFPARSDGCVIIPEQHIHWHRGTHWDWDRGTHWTGIVGHIGTGIMGHIGNCYTMGPWNTLGLGPLHSGTVGHIGTGEQ